MGEVNSQESFLHFINAQSHVQMLGKLRRYLFEEERESGGTAFKYSVLCCGYKQKELTPIGLQLFPCVESKKCILFFLSD